MAVVYNLSVASSRAKQSNKGLTNNLQPPGYKKKLTDFWLENPRESSRKLEKSKQRWT
jgi:hypothetical protein